MLLQLHVARDIRAEWSSIVRERGATEPGMKFCGDGRAAHLGAAFEHQRFEACFGEIESGNQTVVPATDDDDIARFGHRPMRLRLSEFREPPGVRARP